MEKPNFERISLCTVTNSGWGTFSERRLNKYWNEILSGKIEYNHDEVLSTLLDVNHLESSYDDLLFLGKIIFPKYREAEEKAKKQIANLYEFNSEILGALSFLQKNTGKVGIKLFYRDEFVITNNEIIDIFEDSLLKYIKKNNKSLFYAYPPNTSEISKIESIDEKTKQTKELFSKQRGRQHKSIQTKFMVYCLWNYLNENTNLSVKNSPDISKRQIALFIYEYLLVFNFIEKLAKPEDSILDYLKHITKLLGEI